MNLKDNNWKPLLIDYPLIKGLNKCSIGAEMLYTRLIALSDDNWNYWAAPRQVAAQLFNGRFTSGQISEEDITGWIMELETEKIVEIYIIDDIEHLNVMGLRSLKKKKEDVRFPLSRKQQRKKDKEENEDIKKYESIAIADEVINFLNMTCGSTFEYSETSRRPIVARINERVTKEEMKLIIEHKFNEWGKDKKMFGFLRPQTLFGKGKIEGYLSAAKLWKSKGRRFNLGFYKGVEADDDYGAIVE